MNPGHYSYASQKWEESVKFCYEVIKIKETEIQEKEHKWKDQ